MKSIEIKLDREFQNTSQGQTCFFYGSGLHDKCQKYAVCKHHFISRFNKSTRWYLPNGIDICNNCHQLIEYDKKLRSIMEDFIKRKKGKEWLQELYKRSNQKFNGIYEIIWEENQK